MRTLPPRPLWQTTSGARRFGALQGDVRAQVAIIGAGVTGLTAATLLARAGVSVVLLEMHEVAGGETGHTTAHLTELVDARYHWVEKKLGQDSARMVAQSSRAGIEQIATFVREVGAEPYFRRVPAYLYAETRSQESELRSELEAAARAGLQVSLCTETPLPFPVRLAMRVEDQAMVHPREYLLPLADEIVARGGRIFDGTRVLKVDDGAPCRVVTELGTVTAERVLVAANTPINNRAFLHTKVAAYRTYVVAYPHDGRLSPGLYFDLAEPYHYIRPQLTRDGEFILIGGEDHKTGTEEDTEACFNRLAAYSRARFGLTEASHRWSGQVMEPVDGLPFIGRNSAGKHVWVATGYSGTGMTFGTVAGMMFADWVLGRENAWTDLYSATRVRPRPQAADYVIENVDYPTYLVKDRLQRADVASLDEVPFGEGRIVRAGAKKVAAYRAMDGSLLTLSPVCTHLACHVHWNSAETSWDCPCHGSRFSVDGSVLNGPAVHALKQIHLEETPMHAIDKLKAQHRQVETLFSSLEGEQDPDKRRRLFAKLADHVTMHGLLEERLFYPRASQGRLLRLVKHSLEEHGEVKRLISALLGSAPDDRQVRHLKQLIERHVVEEETQLFPEVEALMGSSRLSELALQLEGMQQAIDGALSEAEEPEGTPSEHMTPP